MFFSQLAVRPNKIPRLPGWINIADDLFLLIGGQEQLGFFQSHSEKFATF